MIKTNLKDNLIEFSNGWEEYINDCRRLKGDKYNYYVNSDHPVYTTLKEKIVNQLEGLVDKRIYEVKSSVGASTLAGIPWISIMDKEVTQSTQNGYYLSYLFSKDAKKLYLSIGLGATQFEDRYGANNKTTNKIIKAKQVFVENFKKYSPVKNFKKINLIENDNFIRKFTPPMVRMANYYEAGSFFTKIYNLVNLDFTEEEFVNDVEKYIKSYRDIVLDPLSKPLVDNLDEIVLEDSDRIQKSNLDYDLPSFDPTLIYPKLKATKKSNSNRQKKHTTPSKKVGDAGEIHVYKYEKNKLINADREDLANRIIKQYEDLSSFPGYDIQSFDENGNKIYIEVKSTKNKKKNYFEISVNEIKASIELGDSYYIYQVTNALIDPQISVVIKDLAKYEKAKKILVEPIIYRISYKTN